LRSTPEDVLEATLIFAFEAALCDASVGLAPGLATPSKISSCVRSPGVAIWDFEAGRVDALLGSTVPSSRPLKISSSSSGLMLSLAASLLPSESAVVADAAVKCEAWPLATLFIAGEGKVLTDFDIVGDWVATGGGGGGIVSGTGKPSLSKCDSATLCNAVAFFPSAAGESSKGSFHQEEPDFPASDIALEVTDGPLDLISAD
jgi:hypothetical protein